jgi:hypothetical protein
VVRRLRSYKRDSARLNWLQDKLEEEYFEKHPEWVGETDKAWDAIHQALTDGRLGWNNGTYPLNHVILGGEMLYRKPDYIMCLKNPSQVRDVALALQEMTRNSFYEAYFRIDPETYGFPVDKQDFEYTWGWFKSLRKFWQRAEREGRYILFSADQ